MQLEGLEPTREHSLEPKSSMSTNSIITAAPITYFTGTFAFAKETVLGIFTPFGVFTPSGAYAPLSARALRNAFTLYSVKTL